MRDQELVNALRCVSTAGGPIGDCKKCPFYKTEPVPEDLAGKVNLTEWSSCDVDAVGLAAADRIANQITHIAALQQEIEKLRAQNEQLRESAALVTKESAELLERRWIPVEERLPATDSWGVSKVVLGIVQNESGYPPPNPCFCVYLGNQQWTIRGRMATITHWMPLPEPPEVKL